MSAAMVEALTTLACASPANCFFHVSKPAAVLPQRGDSRAFLVKVSV
jgi:hypothetical protein